MNGLTDAEVIESRKKYGSNSISIKKENKFLRLFIETLGDPIIKLMLIALSIRVVFMFKSNDWYETIGMLISILLSSLISSLSEYGSNKAFERLQSEYEKIRVRVRRNNEVISISNEDIVVGDVVLLSSGEVVPGDGVVISGVIGVDESTINGESKEVEKKKNDKVFKGSVVVSKSCEIRITGVGVNTIYGSIADELKQKEPDSPMKIRLNNVAKIISKIGFVGALLTIISYLFNILVLQGNYIYLNDVNYVIDLAIKSITLGLTIIIVCVPEGLPMMVALVLSSNMKRMLNNNVLVRKLVGVETSGSLNVLLTDKTGTLTKGKLSVIGIVDYQNNKFNNINELGVNKSIWLESLTYNCDSVFDKFNNVIGGNSTDKAILGFIGKQKREKRVVEKLDFDSKNKYSYVILEDNNKYIKGAIDVLVSDIEFYLDKDGSKRVISDKSKLLDTVKQYTSRGIRVISILKNNIFLGFLLIRDDIREEAVSSLEQIKNAGIHVIMITGDDLLTAKSIASDLKMLDNESICLTHDSLSKLSDEEIYHNYKNIKVIARALPKDKSRIASILESNGLVIGMTGDGVNDAPALKRANVGFAMGSGSEVAKEAADIVIMDDNIASICNAILYGRTIFKSIRKFIVFQLTMNLTALLLSIIGPFIGISSPVTVMQMLWINMIMDTLAGLAFSYEAPMKIYMKEQPKKKDEVLINKYMYITISFIAVMTSIILMFFLKSNIFDLIIRDDFDTKITAFFSMFIFLSIFNAFNCRTERLNIFTNIFRNKVFIVIFILIFLCQLYLIYFGGSLFRTFGLEVKELLFIVLISLVIIPIDMIKKYILKRHLHE